MECDKWSNVEYCSSFTKEDLKTNLKKILKKRISKNCSVTINLVTRERILTEYDSNSFNREEIITHLFDLQMRGYEIAIRNGVTEGIIGVWVKQRKTNWEVLQIYVKPMDMCEDYGLIELIEAIAK